MENLYKTGTLHLNSTLNNPTTITIDDTISEDKYQSQFNKTVNRVQKKADDLLPGDGKVPSDAIKYIVKIQMARASTMENPYYRFISQVSAFSTEPMTKFWKKQEDVEKGFSLLNDSSGTVFSAIDAAAGEYEGSQLSKAMGNYFESEKSVSEYVRNRRDYLTSPEVYGKLFLTPMIYGHMNEAQELIQNHCNVSIDLDKFIQSEHSTYFARLVALRMNMSRFLGGRYYTLSNNYGRLMQQTTRILQYFKTKLKESIGGRPMQKITVHQGQSHTFHPQQQVPVPSENGAALRFFDELRKV